mmetsp:Transcript_16909/g.46758  ORF Transcript_16909/g.46758 Transcript_16909/m.46758 type:complete len:179 (-) Transcript_16909:1029-1565(-)
MKLLTAASKLAFVATQLRRPRTIGLASPSFYAAPISQRCTRLFATGGGLDDDAIQLTHIGREQMEEILEDYEHGGREESGYIVIDVRERDEVEYTGQLSENTVTMPLQTIMGLNNAFELDEGDFENVFGFAKPTPDETLVFSCAAGIRSVHAANFAKASGYSNLVNYAGGANEWFALR